MEGCHGAIRRGSPRTVTANRGLAEAMAGAGFGRERLSRHWWRRLRAFGRGIGPTSVGGRVALGSARTTAVGMAALLPAVPRSVTAVTVVTPLLLQKLTGSFRVNTIGKSYEQTDSGRGFAHPLRAPAIVGAGTEISG